MNKQFNLIGIIAITLLLVASTSVSHAGDPMAKAEVKPVQKEHPISNKKHYKQEAKKQEIMTDISFLAKKLLDMSGEDSIVVESPAVMKPFIGICSKILNIGVELTCINPASQAQKGGLKTGDVMLSINGIDMSAETNRKEKDHPFWGIVNNMQTGDILKIVLSRGGEQMTFDVSVGAISHPGYELKVTRK